MADNATITAGILLVFDSGWIGGNNYVISLINSFNYLPANEQPNVIIYYSPSHQGYLKQINYPRIIKTIETDFYADKMKNYLLSVLTGKNRFLKKLPGVAETDFIFPMMDTPAPPSGYTGKIIGWLPDFRHRQNPREFTRLGRLLREFRFTSVFRYCNIVVLSSKHAYQQFFKFYPSFANKKKINILQFVSLAPVPSPEDIAAAIAKYDAVKPFFLVSNQFFIHKNHKIVFDAVAILKKRNIEVAILCTGNTIDKENPGFFETQIAYIKFIYVENNIRILGMIDRMEQLSLMKAAVAIIQPSTYEGWNTSIEDGKKLGINIIASRIDVHKEQLADSPFLFNTDDATDCANLMEGFLHNKFEKQKPIDYDLEIQRFAKNFLTDVSASLV